MLKSLVNILRGSNASKLTINIKTLASGKSCFGIQSAKCFHTSMIRQDLMEFFDSPKNWAEEEVKVGRSWKKDELRLKSNGDLHKLWFVLLKEKNMLLTMEYDCKEEYMLFPNPERIDKVEESMKNLEEVVKERNRAYHELETGQSGERPVTTVLNRIGYPSVYRKVQHCLPLHMNPNWRRDRIFYYDPEEVSLFLRRLTEEKLRKKRRKMIKARYYVSGLMRRFPNLDLEYVKELFPDVNLESLKKSKMRLGHRLND